MCACVCMCVHACMCMCAHCCVLMHVCACVCMCVCTSIVVIDVPNAASSSIVPKRVD